MLKKKRIIFISIATVVVAAAVIAGGIFLVVKLKGKNNSFDKYFQEAAANTEDMVMATGVINIGTVEEKLDIDNMSTTIGIEEILFTTGDSVNEGDALLSLNSEDVAKAEEELAKNLREKELAFRAGEIEHEQNLISAQYAYESTILKGEQADEIYNETVANYKNTLDSATETYNDSVELLAKYKDAKANNTYYEDYRVEYYQKVYEENYDLLIKKCEEWGVSIEEACGRGARLGPDEYSQYVYVLQSLYSVLEDNERNYENALEQYNNDQADLSYNLLSLELNMSTLSETYNNAQKSYELNVLNAEKTRQTAKTNAELAESEYEAKVEQANTEYENLKSAYEDAQSDYDTFKARVVNNQYIAEQAGTVMRSAIRGNDSLTAGSRIVMYSDMSEILVSVSVDQSDIAKLAVGDSVICYSDNTGMLSGTIKSISPVTESTSISSVYYSVTVKIDSAGNNISNNTSVTVVFGYDIESGSEIENMINSNTNSEDGGMPNMEGMPDFSNMDFSNMPDISNMPDMSNMPNMPGR